MNHYDYIVAGLCLRSNIDLVKVGLRGFRPFESNEQGIEADCTFAISTEISICDYVVEQRLSDTYVAEADANSSFMRVNGGYLYTIDRRDGDGQAAIFHIDTHSNHITTNLECHTVNDISLLRFGIWIMFGVVLAANRAIAIHSSVIESRGRCVLFLGESGTGKSTHTRLWRENIEDAHLLNDDSPIIRFIDNQAIVYGSPWSGKTPCYKNLSYPIAGICRLSQAPHNAIRRLSTIASIGAVLPSCPPQYAHDEYLQDCICSTLSDILRRVGVYHLECLPNAEAAKLSHSTIIGDEQ